VRLDVDGGLRIRRVALDVDAADPRLLGLRTPCCSAVRQGISKRYDGGLLAAPAARVSAAQRISSSRGSRAEVRSGGGSRAKSDGGRLE
jgi:hypothetical protein